MTIFHVAVPQDWDAAQDAGEYRQSTRGLALEQVGFIHMSWEHQWPVARRRFYSDIDGPLLLLEVDEARLPDTSPVVVEIGEPLTAEEFPHIYGPIPVDAVVSVTRLDPPHA